jgi:RNA polymerase sigma factor (sigma-70 family)
MPGNLFNAKPRTEMLDSGTQIRAAVEQDHEALLRTVAILVARSDGRLRWSEVMDTAAELLHEAIQEALKHAPSFDPTRSATAWIRGIAARLLLGRRRQALRRRRCVSESALGADAWTAALEQLSIQPADVGIAGQLDLEQALARLAPEERRAIECRYYQGLDGAELARALGVSTPGAARVRVCRALQALRSHFPRGEEEVLP